MVDNLDNSSEESLRRVKELIPDKAANLTFHNCDILDKDGLDKVFAAQKVDAVIHFAGLKAVGESVAKPMRYYSNNIAGTVVLIDAMEKAECRSIIFFFRHRLRRARHRPVHRGFPHRRPQPLRPHQALHRAHAHRSSAL